MVNFSITYKGDLRCELKHEPSGTVIITDAPVDNCGKGESFSPTDLASASLGACMATIMGIYAQKNGIDLAGMKISASKEMSSTTPRRISKICVNIYIPLPSDHPKRQALENAAMSCPVHHSLHPEIEKEISFKWE